MSRVLVLGAGLVSRPLVQYLLDQGFELTVADYVKENAESVIMSRAGAEAVSFDANDDQHLETLVSNHDLIVSLLPYSYHIKVATKAISFKKNMLTASYANDRMKALDKEAKKAGIVILNELGLDPGIDHMSAMKIINGIHSKGGRVDEFYSYCGALPAPEYADNPLKYKFTWSPRGVISASGNNARYKLDGKIINVEGKDLFKDIRIINYSGIGEMEVYPNRDSILYMELYGIQEARTVLRGTIRFPGWCKIMDAMKSLGFLSTDEIDTTKKTFSELLAEILEKDSISNIKKDLADYLNIPVDSEIIKGIEWLGLLDDTITGKSKTSLIDILSEKMLDKMMIGKNEKDMVLMMHTFLFTDIFNKKHITRSTLIDYGSPVTDTAIARTVALPLALGAKLILDNKIHISGVNIPVLPEIYNPILAELENLGIKMEEEYDVF